MAQQKLYTEEQVRQAMILAATTGASYNGILDHLTPIELPSDEEIEHESEVTWSLLTYQDTFKRGAKWMRDKILNK